MNIITNDFDIISLVYTTVCMIVIWIIARMSRQPSCLTDEVRNYVKDKINKIPVQPAPQTDHYTMQQLRNEINQLRVEVSSIKGRSVPMEITNEALFAPVPARPAEMVETIESIETPEEVFYLPTPNPDGSFSASTLSGSYREGASIYQMSISRDDRQHATFQLCPEETAIRLALQYVELRIEPCCRALNAYTGAARRIIPESPGRLELRGDKWIVIDKANIHYEN